jgi:hypothetical protein
LDVADVIWILWPWVEREPYTEADFSIRVNELFLWTEERAVERLAATPRI